jgi:hypothetical protein
MLTYLTTLLTSLAERVTTLRAARTRAPSAPATPLEAPLAARLHAKLEQIAAALRAILARPTPPPTRAPKLPDPRFVPAVRRYDVSVPEGAADQPPETPQEAAKPARLPSHYRWLSTLFPEFLPDRHQLEDRLREDEFQAALAADPRLARAVRKLAWALGVQRNLIPVVKPRRVVVLVADSNVAQAKALYAEARKTMSQEQVLRKYCMFPDHPFQQNARKHEPRYSHDKRPVWMGLLPIPDLLEVHVPFRG